MKGYLEDIRPLSHGGSTPPKKPAPRKRVPKKEIEPAAEETSREEETETSNMPPPVRPYSRNDTASDFQNPKHPWGKLIALLIIGIAVIAAIIYGLSFVFRGATVNITPKSVAGAVNLTLSASQDPSAAIQYDVMTIPDSVSKAVISTTSSVQTTNATGQVVIYNNQSTSQTLIAKTRFADPSGDIFRLQSQIVIPKRTVSGGTTVPGQVTATLVADAAGTAGNIPLSDFTVVAFKGTAKASLVYGRSATPFTGGMSGTMYTLTDQQYQDASLALAPVLQAKLRDEATKQVPQGYVLLPDTLTFAENTTDANTPSQTSSVTVTYSGKMSGVIVKQNQLEAAYLSAIAAGENLTPDQVTFLGEGGLAYHTTSDISKGFPDPINFTVSGNLTAVWNVDTNAIRKALLGSTRSGFAALMQTFPPVKEADLTLHPFWMNKLPTDPKHIRIIVSNPTQ